jgi:homoserine kinase
MLLSLDQSGDSKGWMRLAVPASSANLGSVFDGAAIALDLNSCFSFRVAQKDAVVGATGEDCHLIGRDPKRNLFFTAADECEKAFNFRRRPIEQMSHNEGPSTCGLGSSTRARVAGIVAAAVSADKHLSQKEVFSLTAELEGHPDNAAAAVYGGLVVTAREGQTLHVRRLPVDARLAFHLLVPTYRKASTETMRRVLPPTVDRLDAVYNLQRVAMLVAGFLTGDRRAISLGCADRLHQRYRSPLLPGVAEVLELNHGSGLIGATISGAGPAILLIHARENPDACTQALQVLQQYDPGARLIEVRVADGCRLAAASPASRDQRQPSPGACAC